MTNFNGLKASDLTTLPEDHPSRFDEITSPKHYTVGGHEALDVMKAKLTPEEYIGYLKGNILKYVMRANYKGAHHRDCEKAAQYAKWLAQAVKEMPSAETLPNPPF